MTTKRKLFFGLVKKILVFVVLLSWFIPLSSMALTLGEAVSSGLSNNPKLRASVEELAETRQRIRQAFAGYLPTIDFSVGKGREWVNSPATRFQDQGGVTLERGEAGMNINQPIFDGFVTMYKVEQAQAQLRSVDFTGQDLTETVTLEVVEAFFDIQKQRQLLDVAKESLSIHTDILSKISQTVSSGLSTPMEVRLAQSRLSLIAADLAATEGALQTAEARFTLLVGFSPGSLSLPKFGQHQFPTSRGAVLEAAMRRHPALQASRAELDAVRAEEKSSVSGMWPKVSLEMTLSDTANVDGSRGHSQDASAMLRVKYNLFRGGADHAKSIEMSHKSARYYEKLEQTRIQVEEKVNRSWNTLFAAKIRLKNLENHVEVTKAVYRDHLEQYRLGIQSFLDLLNSMNELHAAKRLLVEEVFLCMTESSRLFAAMGMLKETIANLPPESDMSVSHMDQLIDSLLD